MIDLSSAQIDTGVSGDVVAWMVVSSDVFESVVGGDMVVSYADQSQFKIDSSGLDASSISSLMSSIDGKLPPTITLINDAVAETITVTGA